MKKAQKTFPKRKKYLDKALLPRYNQGCAHKGRFSVTIWHAGCGIRGYVETLHLDAEGSRHMSAGAATRAVIGNYHQEVKD